MSDVSNSLMSLTKNERAWAIGSIRSEEMSDRDQIARFFWVNRSFAHFFCKKQAIRSENQLANSQPW